MAKAVKSNPKKEDKNQIRREIAGVALMALAIFLGVSLYSDAVGIFGVFISGVIFGLTGIVGYAVPPILFIAGLVFIIASGAKVTTTSIVLSFVGLLCILALLQVSITSSIENQKFFEYIIAAYRTGETLSAGGGFLGAVLAFPVLLLIGTIGAYIFLIAALLIIFLAVTRISLKAAGKKVGETIIDGVSAVSEQISSRRQDLYYENLEDQSGNRVSRRGKKPKKLSAQRKTNRLIDQQEEIDFLPTSGPIKKRDLTYNGNSDLYNKEPVYKPAINVPEKEPEIFIDAPVLKPQGKAPAAVPEPKPHIEIHADYKYPPVTLLKTNINSTKQSSGEMPQEKGRLLVNTLASFGIEAKIINITVGPVITRYELQPAQGIRVNRITSLSKDLALSLAAPKVRIEAPIPGKAAIGIEIPNNRIAPVLLRDIIDSDEFRQSRSSTTLALGKDVAGKIIVADLDKMPHLLIAGKTGAGKSVCMNNVIISMVYKASPDDLKMILVDPKKVEFSIYSTLPHLYAPVVTDAKKAAGTLKWAVMEMEQRYQKMAKLGARNLSAYNASLADPQEKMPKLVVVIDELADLMMVAAKEVEDSICRIAQLGRACGIHLIVATQRPSADIITGLIKANIPSRIAFSVADAINSRVILDAPGAEELIGNGDMLFHANGSAKAIRLQGAYASDEEVERVSNFFKAQTADRSFADDILDEMVSTAQDGATGGGKHEDDLLPEAVKLLLDGGKGEASISMIQRRLRVGYARAARLIDIMEQMKIVSGYDGSKPRRLLITHSDYYRLFGGGSELQADE